MKFLSTIQISETEPKETNVLWLGPDNKVRFFNNGKWQEVKGVDDSSKTSIFEIVTTLPTENISTSKIYCVLSDKQGENNKYTEYLWCKQPSESDDEEIYDWEKVGEFVAEPDLSKYVKLNNRNEGSVWLDKYHYFRGGIVMDVRLEPVNGIYFPTTATADLSATKAYTTDGGIADIGSITNYTVTYADGSTAEVGIREIK